MPGREQSDSALMTRVRAGLVNALVQLGRGRENQREKKSAEEPRGRKRVPGIHFASDETQPHWTRLCFMPRSSASTISGLRAEWTGTLYWAQSTRYRLLQRGLI